LKNIFVNTETSGFYNSIWCFKIN